MFDVSKIPSILNPHQQVNRSFVALAFAFIMVLAHYFTVDQVNAVLFTFWCLSANPLRPALTFKFLFSNQHTRLVCKPVSHFQLPASHGINNQRPRCFNPTGMHKESELQKIFF